MPQKDRFSSLRFVLSYARYAKRVVGLSILVGIVAGASNAALMGLISTRVAGAQIPTLRLVLYFVGLVAAVLCSGFASRVLSVYLSQRTSFELQIHLCRQILGAPLRHLEEIGPHRILAVLTDDIPTITAALLNVPQTVINLAMISGCLVYLGLLSWTLLSAVFAFMVFSISSYMILERRAIKFIRIAREERDSLVKHFRTLVEGTKELKLHKRRRASFLSDLLGATAHAVRQNYWRGAMIHAVAASWSQVLYFMVIGFILLVLPSTSAVRPQTLAGYVITVLYLGGPIAILAQMIPFFSRAKVSVQKIEKIGVSLGETTTEEQLTDDVEPRENVAQIDMIEVTHSYSRAEEEGNFHLGPISLTLYPGELIFLVGDNGSGKTTLAKLVSGLYEPESGEIRLNGAPIVDNNRDAYRQNFSMVFSDFYLFDRLLGFDHANLDELAREHLVKLHLDHKVEVKDGRFSTTELSNGQRKRLALLSSYLEDRQIYVFDEWAEGQDIFFKELFYTRLLRELKSKGKTVVVITHDDRYHHAGDRIIKLNCGRIEYDRRADEVEAGYEMFAYND